MCLDALFCYLFFCSLGQLNVRGCKWCRPPVPLQKKKHGKHALNSTLSSHSGNPHDSCSYPTSFSGSQETGRGEILGTKLLCGLRSAFAKKKKKKRKEKGGVGGGAHPTVHFGDLFEGFKLSCFENLQFPSE